MIPLILISPNKKEIDKYINFLIGKYKIEPQNILKILPIKEEITIDQIRQIIKLVIIKNPKTRAIIITDFDSSGIEAQNALLKTLEENTSANLFVLTGTNVYKIIPTICSRSKIILLKKNNSENKKDNLKFAQIFEKAETAKDYSFIGDALISKVNRETALKFMNEAIFYYGQSLIRKRTILDVQIIKKTLDLKELLENNNLNPQLTVDNLLIFIAKTYSMKI